MRSLSCEDVLRIFCLLFGAATSQTAKTLIYNSAIRVPIAAFLYRFEERENEKFYLPVKSRFPRFTRQPRMEPFSFPALNGFPAS